MGMSKVYFQTILEIMKTGHWVTDEVTQVLKRHGITEPQYNVLRILQGAKGQPVTVGAISEGMVQRSSNVTRIVDKLVAKQLAHRTECPTNRRKMDIVITPAGLKALEKMDKAVLAFHRPYLAKLSIEELTTLNNLIQKLRS